MVRTSTRLYKAPADLRKLPPESARVTKRQVITLGDMHGNVIKLIYSVICEGILQGLSVASYRKLYRIYQCAAGDHYDFALGKQMAYLLLAGKVQPIAGLRLLGDLLIDRGHSDDLTFQFFRFLTLRQVPYTILLSNHDAYFLRALYLLEDVVGHPAYISGASVLARMAKRRHHDDPVPGLKDLKAIYLDHLKLVDYQLGAADAKEALQIFTHAPVGLETIEALAKELGVSYDENTPQKLAKTIDAINHAFQQRLNSQPCEFAKLLKDRTSAVFQVIWNRADYIDEWGLRVSPSADAILVKKMRLQPRNRAYRLGFLHGHDGESRVPESNRYCLDNDLGRPGFERGNYMSYRSSLPLRLQPVPLPKLPVVPSVPGEHETKQELGVVRQAGRQRRLSADHGCARTKTGYKAGLWEDCRQDKAGKLKPLKGREPLVADHLPPKSLLSNPLLDAAQRPGAFSARPPAGRSKPWYRHRPAVFTRRLAPLRTTEPVLGSSAKFRL